MARMMDLAPRSQRLYTAAAASLFALALLPGGPALAADDVAAAGGMKVYVDPATGQILPEPPKGSSNALAITPQEQNAMSTSSDGLVETPLARPGGGYKLDLKGRFQSSLVATVGPDGKPRVVHVSPAPAAPTK